MLYHLGEDEEEHNGHGAPLQGAVRPEHDGKDVVADDERRAHVAVPQTVERVVQHVSARQAHRTQRIIIRRSDHQPTEVIPRQLPRRLGREYRRRERGPHRNEGVIHEHLVGVRSPLVRRDGWRQDYSPQEKHAHAHAKGAAKCTKQLKARLGGAAPQPLKACGKWLQRRRRQHPQRLTHS